MPETEETKPKNDAEEVKSALLSVVDRIAGSKAGGSEDSPSPGGSGSTLPVAVALLGVIVIGFSILGIMLVMARRKAAKLAAQVRRLEEDKAQILENQKLEENENMRAASEVVIKHLETKITSTQDQISALKTQNATRAKTLSSITDWDDFVIVDKRAL